MSDTGVIAPVVLFSYLAASLAIGVVAGRRGHGDADDFVTGERSFGPFLMYFVMGAMIFSAYALLGTPLYLSPEAIVSAAQKAGLKATPTLLR